MTIVDKNIPDLRFPEFNDNWKERKIKEITQRYVNPAEINPDVYYREIGIRSHGKGLFHKKPILGKELGNKRVFWIKENAFILNIVFAWEQAIGKTTEKEIGMIASHRFPMYFPKENKSSIDFLLYFFLTKKGKILLELASPGGAGRNKTLGQKEFDNLKFQIPSIQEQQKIALFLNTVDEKIRQLEKKKNLFTEYKKGIIQKFFSQQIRFKKIDCTNYFNWEEKRLEEILLEHGLKSTGMEKVFSVSVNKGLVDQIEHLGRSVSSDNLDNYKIVKPNDIVYTKSPTGDFPFGIIKQSKLTNDVIVSPLYGVFTPITPELGYILDSYFESSLNTYNYLSALIQKGAKNTINISNKTFLSKTIKIPVEKEEQIKIVDFFKGLDAELENISIQLEKTKNFKKGLLQKMFV
ncbi:MAG: restriction endonuclease subunit S [Flavobacteriaceae bacterium]|jgi:type I restriction enzyme S subunit|nr:restriction endonuclease subunit S [Flavobacteriaceae bacterium]